MSIEWWRDGGDVWPETAPIFGEGEEWTSEDEYPSLRASQATLEQFGDLLKNTRRLRQIDQTHPTPEAINAYAVARDKLIEFVHLAIWPGESEG